MTPITRHFPTIWAATTALASLAQAQSFGDPFIRLESSLDGENWTNNLRTVAVQPNSITRVQFRVRMVLENPASQILGFAGATYQPVLRGWREADRWIPFSYPSGTAGPYGPWVVGRIAPFGGSGMGPSSASGVLTAFEEGDTLRFAGANAAPPTTNLAWGVSSSQLTEQLSGTNFHPGVNPIVFQFSVELAAGDTDRSVTATAPLEYINLRRLTWYTQPNGLTSAITPVTESSILPATVFLTIPAPEPLLLLTLAFPLRRRRASRHAPGSE
jgi:hypothetical protein